MFSGDFSRQCRMTPTWNTRWSTPPSSRSIATARAQKGNSEPGHWQIQRRHDRQDPGAHRCAWEPDPLRPAAGASLETVGVAPLIKNLEFGGRIANKAFDPNAILTDLDES